LNRSRGGGERCFHWRQRQKERGLTPGKGGPCRKRKGGRDPNSKGLAKKKKTEGSCFGRREEGGGSGVTGLRRVSACKEGRRGEVAKKKKSGGKNLVKIGKTLSSEKRRPNAGEKLSGGNSDNRTRRGTLRTGALRGGRGSSSKIMQKVLNRK